MDGMVDVEPVRELNHRHTRFALASAKEQEEKECVGVTGLNHGLIKIPARWYFVETPILRGMVFMYQDWPRRPWLLAAIAFAVACAGSDDGPGAREVQSASLATEDGWRPLFDGSSFAGWRGLGRDSIPTAHWVIEGETIRKVASGTVPTAADGQPLAGGDIMTIDTFTNFELSLEWKVSPGGNSGIKYNVSEAMSTSAPPEHAALGFEYQILDDELHPDAANGPTRQAGALYDMIPAGTAKALRSVGEFNDARVVFRNGHGEHWLNGVKVLEYDVGTARFDSLLATSKYAPIENFAELRAGHIVLQDHGDDVWFRNIRIRTVEP